MTDSKTHPSYALIHLDRVNGDKGCFMSRTQGSGHVVMTIEQAECLSDGRPVGTNRLVRLKLTFAQYLELISSLNMGPGIPCTLTYLQGPVKEYKPEPNQLDTLNGLFQKEFNDIELYSSKITDYLEGLKDKGRASKSDIQEIERLVRLLLGTVKSNLPSIAKICADSISKYVQGAKLEILAYTSRLFDK